MASVLQILGEHHKAVWAREGQTGAGKSLTNRHGTHCSGGLLCVSTASKHRLFNREPKTNPKALGPRCDDLPIDSARSKVPNPAQSRAGSLLVLTLAILSYIATTSSDRTM